MQNNMKHVLEFVNTKDIEKTKIFTSLQCTKDEALILQYMLNSFLHGNTEGTALEILRGLYGLENPLSILNLMDRFQSLMNLGWIRTIGGEPTLLELINSPFYLSSGFFRVLENLNNNTKITKISSYVDDLDYLKDQFCFVDILHDIFMLKKYNKNSPLLTQNTKKLTSLESRIKKRLTLTKDKPSVEAIFNNYNLDRNEKMIFLVILKEEYSPIDNERRDLNYLINIISNNNDEKIKNRYLLDDDSRLIESGLIESDVMFGGNRSFYISDHILRQIINQSTKHKTRKKISLQNLVEDHEVFEFVKPKHTLDEVILNKDTRKLLDSLLRQMDTKVLTHLKEWGIKNKNKDIESKIIFYGVAGTGKTMTALALAKSLKKEVLSFDCSKILSMYVGESEKNVRRIFDSYYEIRNKSKQTPILLLDEADQFLSTRSLYTSGADKMHNQMQNIFLEQIEKFDGILIATTNLLETIDSAFSRRFNYKIEFKKPNLSERKLLWEKMLPKNAPYEKSFSIDSLCEFSLTGGQIFIIIKNVALLVATMKKPLFTTQVFTNEIKRELASNFDGVREVGFNT